MFHAMDERYFIKKRILMVVDRIKSITPSFSLPSVAEAMTKTIAHDDIFAATNMQVK
jgi:hypothetical protein